MPFKHGQLTRKARALVKFQSSDVADLLVIGGGIIGLAVAHEWLVNRPMTRVIILEKEIGVGLHASGRNSGVLHAGFYYSPDSLKAKFTREGNKLLKEFLSRHGVLVRQNGKVVVTRNEAEVYELEALYRKGLLNGVSLELVSAVELKRIEPRAETYQKALWSPSTAVADPMAVINALACAVTDAGGEIALGEKFLSTRNHVVRTNKRQISAAHVINCAGLYSDKVAEAFQVETNYKLLPFKGLYWYGGIADQGLLRHVYPVPNPMNPFLGVHLTVTVDGRTKIGPTAIPGLWREDYGGLKGFSLREFGEVLGAWPRLLRSKHHDFPTLIRQELPKYFQRVIISSARQLVPSIDPKSVTVRGKVGVRAQLVNLQTKQLEMDFSIADGQYSTHILNAVSPAWTSSFAFARYICSYVEARL